LRPRRSPSSLARAYTTRYRIMLRQTGRVVWLVDLLLATLGDVNRDCLLEGG
jgi:hypothetical protein